MLLSSFKMSRAKSIKTHVWNCQNLSQTCSVESNSRIFKWRSKHSLLLQNGQLQHIFPLRWPERVFSTIAKKTTSQQSRRVLRTISEWKERAEWIWMRIAFATRNSRNFRFLGRFIDSLSFSCRSRHPSNGFRCHQHSWRAWDMKDAITRARQPNSCKIPSFFLKNYWSQK